MFLSLLASLPFIGQFVKKRSARFTREELAKAFDVPLYLLPDEPKRESIHVRFAKSQVAFTVKNVNGVTYYWTGGTGQ